MKKFLIFTLLFLLAGCFGNKTDVYKIVKAENLQINIPKNFQLVTQDEKLVGKYKILYEYKQFSFSGFSDSLLIGKYIGNYPKNEEKFFSLLKDKFIKRLPGSTIIDTITYKADNILVYIFVYSVSNNLFENNPSYYGLQAYLFYKKQVYIINLLDNKKDNVYKFIDSLKNIKGF